MKYLIWLILSILPLTQLQAQEGKASFDIVWKKTLTDPGQSGILFHNDDLFFTSHDVTGKEVNGGGRLISNIVKGFCYDGDGNMKWEIKMETRAGGIVHETFLDGTSITPVADEKSVYFFTGLGKMLCVDRSGKEKWSHIFRGGGNGIQTQMILYKNTVIVSLPVKKGIYGLQAFDKETGEVKWKSDTALNHVCQYVMSEYQGKPAIYATATELAHYKDIQGNHLYFISPEDGKQLMHKEISEKIDQGFRCIKHDGKLINMSGRNGREPEKGILLVDEKSDEVTTIAMGSKNHIRYKYTDGKFDLDQSPYRLGGHDYTLSSMAEANGKLFYRTKGDLTAGIRCIDLATHKITDVQVPFQIINGKKIWVRRDRNGKYLVFPKGVYDAQGKAIYTRESNHSYRCYGWGHIVCTAPVQVGDMLYWVSALGMIYAIELNGEFTPEKVQTFSIDPVGEAWTQGQLAYHDDHIYVRSQQALFKIRVKK